MLIVLAQRLEECDAANSFSRARLDVGNGVIMDETQVGTAGMIARIVCD